MAETYRPTKGMQDEAKKALGWIADGKAGSGFTDVGRKRASDIAAGRAMSAEIVLRMYSFFARHEVDKKGEGFTMGDKSFPSAGRVSWAAWGGDAGFSWSTKIRNQLIKRSSSIAIKEGQMKLTQRAEMYGATNDPILHGAMAADAALDAAQMLIANCEDPIVQQAYLLMCAADAALSEVIEACGGMDEDDEEEENTPMMALSAYSEDISEVQKRAGVTTGSKVSWNTSNGMAYGKVEKVQKSGTASSSADFNIEADAENPAYKIRIYKQKDNEWVATDVVVVHRKDILKVLTDFPASRSEETSLVIEERKVAIATAEKITMTAEVRALDTEDGSMRIGGYAATFNQEADGLHFREVIAPGAFTRALASQDPVFLLINHDMEGIPLASTQSGTLQLRQDKQGLYMEAELDSANPRAQELASALKRGDMDKMSFAFTVAADGQTRSEGLRTLTEIDRLFEVSVVTLPAYSSTSVGMRSADETNLEIEKKKLTLKFNQYSLRQKRKG